MNLCHLFRTRHLVLAILLGQIHSGIRLIDELRAVCISPGPADGDRYGEFRIGGIAGRDPDGLHFLHQAIGQGLHFAICGLVPDHTDKFVAAIAIEGNVICQAEGQKRLASHAQALVSHRMAELIVKALEIIDIHHEDGMDRRLGALFDVFHEIGKAEAAVEAGQIVIAPVVVCLVIELHGLLDLLLQLLLLLSGMQAFDLQFLYMPGLIGNINCSL